MADVLGNEGAFSYSTGAGPINADVGAWAFRAARPEYPTTRFGYTSPRKSFGMLEVRGTCRVVSTDGTTAPVPNGTSGSLVLTSVSGHTYTFNAVMHALERAANALSGEQQYHNYEFVATASSASANMTVA